MFIRGSFLAGIISIPGGPGSILVYDVGILKIPNLWQ